MPLDTENGKAIVRNALNNAVSAAAEGLQRVSKTINSLMMSGIDDRAGAVKLIEKVVTAQTAVVNRVKLVMPDPLMQRRAGKILTNRSAEVDINQLKPLADTENRTPALYEKIKNLQLKNIQLCIRLAGSMIVLTKKSGSDISAARKHKIVSGCRLFFAERGKDADAQSAEGFFIVLCIAASAGNCDIRGRGHNGITPEMSLE